MGCVGEAGRGRLWPSGRCCSMGLTRGRSSSGALPWLAAQIRNVSPFADVPHWGPTAAQPCTPPRGDSERTRGCPPSTPSPAAGVAHARACAPLAFSVPVESLTVAPCQHQKTRVARSRGCISRRDGEAELILTVRVAVGLYGGSRSGTHGIAARPASSAPRFHLRRVCTVIVSPTRRPTNAPARRSQTNKRRHRFGMQVAAH